MRVVFTRPLPVKESVLRVDFDSVTVSKKKTPLTPQELIRFAKDADTVICTLEDRLNATALKKLPKLKHLVTYSVGVNHIDVKFARSRGIRISYTPGILTEATADLTWALLLAAARHLVPAANWVRDGKFKGYRPDLFLGKELNGATLGIVGKGRIGEAVARRAGGFGMKVIYHNRSSGIKLEELLRNADIVSLHCPLTPQTTHLIGKKQLALMKNNAILINTSRGPVIDEKALVEHLRKHPSFVAGLDVFENEPSLAPGLAKLPNAVCVPHIGSATEFARTRMAEVCVEEAAAFAKGQPLRYEYIP